MVLSSKYFSRVSDNRRFTCYLALAFVALFQSGRADAGVVTDVIGSTVWFDAEQIAGLNDGELVSLWPDRSGNAYDLTQANADNQPIYRDGANGLNGRPVVRFDGDPAETVAPDIGDRMNTFTIPTSNDYTMMLVWKTDNTTAQIPFSKFQQAAGKREWAFWYSTNLRMSTSVNGTNRVDHVYAGETAPTTDYVVDIVTKEGTVAPLFRNGLANLTGVAVNATLMATAQSPISVGTSFGATTNYLKGTIAEAIVYNHAINGGERVVVQNYLAAKWGQPLDPAEDFYIGDDNAQGDYDSDVIGIGQAGGGKLTSSHGSGLAISELGATLDADSEFVMAGHKTATNALTSNDVGPVPYADQRWGRVWYVDRAGDLGAQLQFDFSEGGLADPAGGTTFTLLYSPTNAFNFSVQAGTTVVANTDQVSFNLPSGFADGYYTIGLGTHALLQGDVNFDGVVNIFDINLVSSHWNEGGPAGDANGDAVVNIFDINLISSHWNESVPGSATAVPEPASYVLAGMALVGLFVMRRKSR